MSLRVLIVDDSALVRRALRLVLTLEGCEVVGEAADGVQAEALVERLRPDVITMDVLMPMMGGMESIESIMDRCPTPIVVVANAHGDAQHLAMEALARGAFDVFPKPREGFTAASARALVALLRTAARVKPGGVHRAAREFPPALDRGAQRVVGIVASTGGPRLLRAILQALPATFPCPIAIVQHTAAGFTSSLATWLAGCATLPVSLAVDGQRLVRGVVVAPEDAHLELRAGGRIVLERTPPVAGHRPSGTLLLRSIAAAYRSLGIGIVLTGMGADGAEGLQAIEAAGGLAIVEDPATAVVGGMPGAARALTHKPIVEAGDAIGPALARLFEAAT